MLLQCKQSTKKEQSARLQARLSKLLQSDLFVRELQKAGYATDPAYARKLSGAIQSALRAMA